MDYLQIQRAIRVFVTFAASGCAAVSLAGRGIDPPAPPAVIDTGEDHAISPSDLSLEPALNDSGTLYEYASDMTGGELAGSCGCGGDCCSDCDECCGCSHWLFDYLQPTDMRFCQFVSPITNPVFFEDPRTLTEARFIFLHHKLPGALGGGEVQLYALQLRAALNDRLSVIAIKDGFAVGQPDAPHDDGWADVAAGVKYLLLEDCCGQWLLSGGVTFELPVGSTRALQGTGDGEFNVFLSGAAEFGDGWLYMSAAGARLPTNTTEESQSTYWSHHLSHRLGCSNFYSVVEVNWYHWLRSGAQPALAGIEGLDVYNFGSTGVAGNDIVTGAVGLRYKPDNLMEIGLAWEGPFTDRRDIMDNRITFDWILRY